MIEMLLPALQAWEAQDIRTLLSLRPACWGPLCGQWHSGERYTHSNLRLSTEIHFGTTANRSPGHGKIQGKSETLGGVTRSEHTCIG